MPSLLLQADAVLRGRQHGLTVAGTLGVLVVFGLVYGLAMGTYSGIWGDRTLQLAYSAVKVPLLLTVTFLVALPSFAALNTIAGLRGDLAEVVRALLAAQAGLTVVLASLAPLTLVFYASSDGYEAAILFNGLMFLGATLAAQWILRRSYAPLIARDPRHRLLMWTWLLTYGFVGIQAGWVLRPFIGRPGLQVVFFREGAWGNAYVEVLEKIRVVVAG